MVGYNTAVSEHQVGQEEKGTAVCHQLLHAHCHQYSLNCSVLNNNINCKGVSF